MIRNRASLCVLMLALGAALWVPSRSGASVYRIGPGKQYSSVGQAPWERLAPGDVVEIYWRPHPYFEKVRLTCRGTEGQPIRIIGIPGPNGDLPILDAMDATTAQSAIFRYAPTQDRGLVIVTPAADSAWGYKPGYLQIENLEMRNACEPNSFTDARGQRRNYSRNAAALFVERGEHIVVRGCTIDGSGNGLFVASGDSEEVQSRDFLIDGCCIYGNGNVGRDREHNIYTEAIGIIFQNNFLGAPRAGSLGSNLKDRSSRTVIRYNWIEDGAHMLDLVEAQESYKITGHDAGYHNTSVYGNVFINGPNPGGSSSMIHYGGDNGDAKTYRKGVLHFDHNTVVIQCDQSGAAARWRTVLLQIETDDEATDVHDNIIFCQPATAGGTPTELTLLNIGGTATLGKNWISPVWTAFRSGVSATGRITGKENLITNRKNEPGFVNLAAGNLRLAPNAQAAGLGVPLQPDVVGLATKGRGRGGIQLR